MIFGYDDSVMCSIRGSHGSLLCCNVCLYAYNYALSVPFCS